jgi:hypothetical protein
VIPETLASKIGSISEHNSIKDDFKLPPINQNRQLKPDIPGTSLTDYPTTQHMSQDMTNSVKKMNSQSAVPRVMSAAVPVVKPNTQNL